jgi:hypothetical protein
METYFHCTEHHVVVHTKTQGYVIYVRQTGSVDIDCMQLAHVEISDRFFECGDGISCFGRNRIGSGVSAYQRRLCNEEISIEYAWNG